MNSTVKELYEVAQEYARNESDCSVQQFNDALSVIELIEDGEYDKALLVGLVY